ncbi:hypothetical protein NPIL_146741 [Nephila pilipes]|uniref:Uncharacterized protein n=1 Tax=Nephila pilipes TaxID=299642 RepID=A0A8X6U627_NEPPI|nr:hypothetical protein NPIL_146741 [Nephila pilipes]
MILEESPRHQGHPASSIMGQPSPILWWKRSTDFLHYEIQNHRPKYPSAAAISFKHSVVRGTTFGGCPPGILGDVMKHPLSSST